jgi:hypothetical protein
MKKLAVLSIGILTALLLSDGPAAGQGAGELKLRVTLTTGERSRDSSSETTTITLEQNKLVWARSYGGRRGRTTPPARKQFVLSAADRQLLIDTINTNELWVTDAIELEQDAPLTYFRITADLSLGTKTGAIAISGPRVAVQIKQERLYQRALVLVKALFRHMNEQDRSVRFEELILDHPNRP